MRTAGFVESMNKLHKLRIQMLLCPGNIGAVLAYSAGDSVHTDLFAVIKKDNGVAGADPLFIGPAVIAINDPEIIMQYFIKLLIKFLPRNVRLVRPPPDIVEVDQRETGACSKLS